MLKWWVCYSVAKVEPGVGESIGESVVALFEK